MSERLQAPEESIFEMANIQAIAIRGFFKPHKTLLCVRVPDGRQTMLNSHVAAARQMESKKK